MATRSDSDKRKPATRRGTAVMAKGRETAAEVIDAAAAVVLRDGYAKLSMRRVAAEAGIRLGNLQYYFPTRGDLLRGLSDSLIQRFMHGCRKRLAGIRSPIERLTASADYILERGVEGDLAPLLWGPRTLARDDAEALRVIDAFYTACRTLACEALEALNPHWSEPRRGRTAALMISLLTGASVFVDDEGTRHEELSKLRVGLRKAVLCLAEDG